MANIFNVSQIIDFTNLVMENDKWICFNPCVTHYKNNLYLCCFRTLTKGYDMNEEKYVKEAVELSKNVYGNPNHPWRYRWKADTKEPPLITKQYTRFFMLMINQLDEINFEILIVKEYKELFNDNLTKRIDVNNVENYVYVANGNDNRWSAFQNFFENMYDVRINGTNVEGLFFLTGNCSNNNDQPLRRINQDTFNPNPTAEQNCQVGGCTSICIIAFTIDPVTLKMRYLNNTTILCPEISARTEKNWSLIIDDLNVQNIIPFKITYQIRHAGVGHEVYSSGFNITTNQFANCVQDDKLVLVNNILLPTQNYVTTKTQSLGGDYTRFLKLSLYYMIEKAFSVGQNDYLHISSTTPTIKYNQNEYLSVGHVKFQYQNIMNEPLFINTPIRRFVEYCRDNIVNFHFGFIYLLFFYTLDVNDLSILRISNFLMPQPADVSLIFPMGLTKIVNTDNFIVSYGNYDNTCEAMFFHRESLENALMSIYTLPFLDNIQVDQNGLISNSDQIYAQIRNYDFFQNTGWVYNNINKYILK